MLKLKYSSLMAVLVLAGCGAKAPSAENLELALKQKLAAEHALTEEKLKNMTNELEHRMLDESLSMQKAQTFKVNEIRGCETLPKSEYRCDVQLNISMQGLPGSQNRDVEMLAFNNEGTWVIKKLSIPARP